MASPESFYDRTSELKKRSEEHEAQQLTNDTKIKQLQEDQNWVQEQLAFYNDQCEVAREKLGNAQQKRTAMMKTSARYEREAVARARYVTVGRNSGANAFEQALAQGYLKPTVVAQDPSTTETQHSGVEIKSDVQGTVVISPAEEALRQTVSIDVLLCFETELTYATR
jgi:hypothetical protein